MAFRTYDPAKLTGYLLADFKRTGGLTAEQIDLLYSNGPSAPVTRMDVDVTHIWKCFEAAKANGIQKPGIHIDGYTFKMAPDYGANRGAIYVTEDTSGFNEYLGKIKNGKFMPVAKCTPAHLNRIVAVAKNPLEAVLAFGKKYGRCSMCARKLTDPKSIEMGVGPICRANYGL